MGMELKCRRKIEENLFHINFCDALIYKKTMILILILKIVRFLN